MATRTHNETPGLIPEIRELSDAEWEQLVDDKARQYFGISAREFERRLDAGEIDIDDDPDVMRVAMLLPPRAESE
jgi:hypothetical protein